MTFLVPSEYDSKPLLAYLRGGLSLSSRMISRLKKLPGGILLDGVHVTVRAPLRAGCTLTLSIDTAGGTPSDIVPTPLPLDVLYEDEHLIVCNKSGDMPTHPSHGHFTDTLANALAHREGSAGNNRFVFRPINRLDRNTSGAVLIARHALAAQRLATAMQSGKIRKDYFALLCGTPYPTQGDIRTGLRRREASIITREICPTDAPGASLAHTAYQLLHTWSPTPNSGLPSRLSLVRAHPITGRTHQLRLHFSHVGCPILGDDMYGLGTLPGIMERQALHAYQLQFPHPISGHLLTVTAPLPKDMRALIPFNLPEDSYAGLNFQL